MELDEMKSLWDHMSKELEKQKLLTDKVVLEMTQNKFKDKLSDISIPETVGTIICFAMAVYTILNFYKLDNWYLILFGVISVSLCVFLPVLSLRSISKMKNINVSKNSYKESLKLYAKGKDDFVRVQKAAYYLGFIFSLVVLPVAGKILRNKDLILEARLWIWYIPLAILFHFLFSKWVHRHYASTTKSARSLLEELKD